MTRARRECSNLIGLLSQTATIRDDHPERGKVHNLTHGLQMADRTRAAGYDEPWIVAALIHDAAKPLTLIWHGEAVATITHEYYRDVDLEIGAYLSNHSRLAYGPKQTALGKLDAASFDPDYPTPNLDEMIPYLERFYGIA